MAALAISEAWPTPTTLTGWCSLKWCTARRFPDDNGAGGGGGVARKTLPPTRSLLTESPPTGVQTCPGHSQDMIGVSLSKTGKAGGGVRRNAMAIPEAADANPDPNLPARPGRTHDNLSRLLAGQKRHRGLHYSPRRPRHHEVGQSGPKEHGYTLSVQLRLSG